MKIAVIKEQLQGETRVALLPANVTKLVKAGATVTVETQAGFQAGFTDQDYLDSGATIANDRQQTLADAQLVLTLHAKGEQLTQLLEQLSAGQTLIGMMDPLGSPQGAQQAAEKGINAIALELVPRITRAQSMDVLSSNATIAGYKAVLQAADLTPRMMPMMMTAAGTLKPARTFVMGAGVAGLQACATAKRLGAVVEAYDIRPAAREQIISVGARPVELDIEDAETESKGGYAKEQSAEFIAKQQQAMADILAQQDIVITTAAIPGRKAPILITKEMVAQMKPGSVIVDLAAETGGNCELTQLGEVIEVNGVTISGPNNIVATTATHGSQMFGTNLENLIKLMLDDEANLQFDFEDEIVRDTVTAYNGDVVNPRIRELLGLANPEQEEA
ncbi:Re/Si-specific NAD(P)(+) transhydrogenase subunit alpha [Ferrimonas aestuarii]|uniref:NAD(P) transhydrogenase subunit alpha part 1 n=1 Tax=Ferrimonas aestuarii TaxID=2569539 RepID=A0A4U1BRG0_9GAMM|nr:Re/Si-specific NAD(P)(+) transhydrogenase subunit alpha [Ferrimonas aestuarii]TKB56748.1 Re/Si-specific NAD(P)(+) transhydrogenase subunit alpha [Ferrimonas aestuarii]